MYRPAAGRRDSGVTLLELMISLVILGGITLIALGLAASGQSYSNSTMRRVTVNERMQTFLEYMERQLVFADTRTLRSGTEDDLPILYREHYSLLSSGSPAALALSDTGGYRDATALENVDFKIINFQHTYAVDAGSPVRDQRRSVWFELETSEIADGLDNDADGLIDEGLARTGILPGGGAPAEDIVTLLRNVTSLRIYREQLDDIGRPYPTGRFRVEVAVALATAGGGAETYEAGRTVLVRGAGSF